jgi:hypothetical protein
VYVSSFWVSQRDVFKSVKRVTKTADEDWTVTHENTKQRYQEGLEGAKQGSAVGWMKIGYSRMFFANGDGDYKSSHGPYNQQLGLPVEVLDDYTAIGIRMGENGELWP